MNAEMENQMDTTMGLGFVADDEGSNGEANET